jgi:hypothetical protein
MRTSLNNIKQTEDYLQHRLTPDEKLLYDAKLILDPMLRLNVLLQKKIYGLIKAYGRQSAREQLAQIHEQLFKDPAKAHFRKTVINEFKKD